MRTNFWLNQKFQEIKNQSFNDVPLENTVIVKFGQKSRTRLGSIILKKLSGYPTKVSFITITGFMRDEKIPEEIVEITLAHELVHYTHGFSSPRRRLYRFPHQGSIVDSELIKRGLKEKLIFLLIPV